jgi:hypothetical protein
VLLGKASATQDSINKARRRGDRNITGSKSRTAELKAWRLEGVWYVQGGPKHLGHLECLLACPKPSREEKLTALRSSEILQVPEREA